MPETDDAGILKYGAAAGWRHGFCGRGLGRGFCRMVCSDKEALLAQKAWLEKRLDAIGRQLEEK